MTLVLPIPRPRSGVHPPPNNGDKNLLMVNSQDYSLLLLGFWTVQRREIVTLSLKTQTKRSKTVSQQYLAGEILPGQNVFTPPVNFLL